MASSISNGIHASKMHVPFFSKAAALSKVVRQSLQAAASFWLITPFFSQKPSSLSSSIFIFPEWSAYPAYWSVLRQFSFPSFLRIGR
jgi:hypothetical protein